ncbi:hypothetical protein [Rhodanobacter sp. MP7CTX1]|nr:hypothetical protein [Rhodanobacter sp. MP7CTX1]MBB6186663.1 hypothetical protein [Rhodanobacter sp. MP7CTX1]
MLALMREELKFRFNVSAYEAAQKKTADHAKNQVGPTLDAMRKGASSQQG